MGPQIRTAHTSVVPVVLLLAIAGAGGYIPLLLN